MSLLQQIKDDQLQARKNRDSIRTGILTTLIGEASIIGKNKDNRESTDDEVINTIKKFLSNIKDSLNMLTEEAAAKATLLEEREIISNYLPEPLTEDQLTEQISLFIVENSISSLREVGKVMKFLRENYNGKYDGKIASQMVQEMILAHG